VSGRSFACALLVALAALCTAAAAAPAQWESFKVTSLRVEDGGSWHAKPVFRLDWDQVPAPPAKPGAVVYQLYDPHGNPVGEPIRNSEDVSAIDRLPVPPTPGAYTVEVWLENNQGDAGAAASATLRFDDAVPSPPLPLMKSI